MSIYAIFPLFTILLTATIVWWATRDLLKGRRLRRIGIKAQAKLIAINQTNTRINGNPVIEFLVDVYPPDGGIVQQTRTRSVIPQILLASLPQPGSMVPVLCDPKNPTSLVIDFKTLGGELTPTHQATTPPSSTSVSILSSLFFILPIGVMVILFVFTVNKSIGHEIFALDSLNQCSEAKTLLGDPIEKNVFGWSCGNAKSGGGFGYANWELAVKGPKTRGTFYFYAEKHGGVWSLTRGKLKVNEATIDVLACLTPTAPTATTSKESGESTTRQIRGTLSALNNACNRGDRAACAALSTYFKHKAQR